MQADTLKFLDTLNDKIDFLIQNSGSSDVILAAFVGAAAAVIPQLIIYELRRRKEKKNKILELKSELFRLTELLRDHYRELALHKAHKFYWWANYSLEKEKEENGIENEAQKMHDFHMSSSDNVRETELKISETFSQYNKVISKLQMLTKYKEKVQELLDKYKNYEPSKPKDLDTEIPELLSTLENEEESRLKKEYKKFLDIIEKINSNFITELEK